MFLDLVATLFNGGTCARLIIKGMTGDRNSSARSRSLTSFEASGEVVSGRLKISRKVAGFLQSFLQSGLQQEGEGPPELVILAGLMMSGRLDSNQRPPEPHSGSSRLEDRKSKPIHCLQISHFPHSTQRNPQNPLIPGSFLQFPA
jgi:hypothetical protein